MSDESDELERWIESRPPAVRAVVRAKPPTNRYTIRGDKLGRYVIASYSEHVDDRSKVTVVVQHDADSLMPGVEVFGVNPDDLIPIDEPRATLETVALRQRPTNVP